MAAVNINEADEKELTDVEDIGPVLAGRIVEHREQNGFFASEDELLKVKGIGENRLARIKEKNEIIVKKSSSETKTVVGDGNDRDLCPALQDCPFYKEEYCKRNYEECARYKIILSDLDSKKHLLPNLLPTDYEKAENILEEKD